MLKERAPSDEIVMVNQHAEPPKDYVVSTDLQSDRNGGSREEDRGSTNCSMALSHAGAGLASPFTSFRVLVSRSPRMYDISAASTTAGGRSRN